MLDYFIWLTLGLIIGYIMGLRKIKDYFGGIDPVDLMKDNFSYLKEEEDDEDAK